MVFWHSFQNKNIDTIFWISHYKIYEIQKTVTIKSYFVRLQRVTNSCENVYKPNRLVLSDSVFCFERNHYTMFNNRQWPRAKTSSHHEMFTDHLFSNTAKYFSIILYIDINYIIIRSPTISGSERLWHHPYKQREFY